MKIKELLKILADTAVEHSIHTPYIVGGIPRDILLDKLDIIRDIDITTGHKDVDELADLFANKVDGKIEKQKDGHKRVTVGNIAFDFSSNFIYDNIEKLVGPQDDNLLKETYSRDFTINMLLLPLDFSKVIDITGKSLKDIENKEINCIVDCDIVFKNSPIRMMRAIFYAAKYNFNISDEVKKSIINNLDLFVKINKQYMAEKINYIVKNKPELLNELIEMGILSKMPLTKELGIALIKNRRLLDVI